MFKITQQLKRSAKIWLLLILGVLLATNLWAGWSSKELLYDHSVGFWGMALGDGRNDGVNRFYLACSDSTVKEFRPGEIYETICKRETDINALALGSGRNDNVNRLYVVYQDGKVYEYTYEDSLWNVTPLGNSNGRMWAVKLGVGRNDDSVRVYTCGDSAIFEFTFRNGSWLPDTVDKIPASSILVGFGHNNSLNRLFVNSAIGILEYTYSEGKWLRDTIALTAEIGGPLAKIGPLVIGVGQNDDTNRVYLGVTNWTTAGEVMEFTFNDGFWSKDSFKIPDIAIYALCLGTGRGNGENRIYMVTSTFEGEPAPPFAVREFSYAETQWTEELVAEIYTGFAVDLIIGSLNKDDSTHLYVSLFGSTSGNPIFGVIYDFFYTAGIEECPKHYPRDFVLFPNEPNPFHEGTWIVYQIGSPQNVSMRVFDCTGRLIRILANQINEPARYEVFWDGRDSFGRKVPSGTYFLCLSANGRIKTQKAILIR